MSTEALALLEKYGRKPTMPPCPPEVMGLLKDLSDLYIKTGRKIGRDSLLKELSERGYPAGKTAVYHWIVEAGGQPWFAP